MIDLGLQQLTSLENNLTVPKEERASGAVSGNVYADYIRANKSWFLLTLFLLLQIVRVVSEVMMRLNQANLATLGFDFVDSEEYLHHYGILLTVYIISYMGASLLLATILINSARFTALTNYSCTWIFQ